VPPACRPRWWFLGTTAKIHLDVKSVDDDLDHARYPADIDKIAYVCLTLETWFLVWRIDSPAVNNLMMNLVT
jgi:hypothetical protein